MRADTAPFMKGIGQSRAAVNQYVAHIGRLKGELAKGTIDQEYFNQSLGQARAKLEASGSAATRAATGINLYARAFVAMAAARAAMGAVKAVVDPALAAEKAMLGLRKATGLDPTGVGELKGDLQQLSITMKGTKVGDLYEIATVGSKMGIATGDIVEYTKGIAMASMAMDDIPADQVAEGIGKINIVFGLGVRGSQQLASAIDKVGDSGVASNAAIMDVTQRVSGAASAAHITAQESIGLAGALLDTGTQAELAGTTITRLIMSLNKVANHQGFADALGISAKKFGEMVKESPFAAIQAFLHALRKMDAAAQQTTISNIGIKSVLATGELMKLAQQADVVDEHVARARSEFETLNQATSNTAMVAETTGAALEQAANHAKILADAIGATLLPVINAGVAVFGKFAETMEGVALGLEHMKGLGWAEWLTTGVGSSALAAGIGKSLQLAPKAVDTKAANKAKLAREQAERAATGLDEDEHLTKKELRDKAHEAADAFKEMSDRAGRAFESTRTPAEKLRTQMQELNAMWAVGAIDVVTFARSMADARKEMAKDSGAEALIESTRTPLEKFQAELKRIQEMEDAGSLPAGAAGRGRAAALAALNEARKGKGGAEVKFAGALELGSKEARTAIVQHRFGAGTGDPIRDVAREAKQQTVLARESVILQRQLVAQGGATALTVVPL